MERLSEKEQTVKYQISLTAGMWEQIKKHSDSKGMSAAQYIRSLIVRDLKI